MERWQSLNPHTTRFVNRTNLRSIGARMDVSARGGLRPFPRPQTKSAGADQQPPFRWGDLKRSAAVITAVILALAMWARMDLSGKRSFPSLIPQSQRRSAGANQRPLLSPHRGTDVKGANSKPDRGAHGSSQRRGMQSGRRAEPEVSGCVIQPAMEPALSWIFGSEKVTGSGRV